MAQELKQLQYRNCDKPKNKAVVKKQAHNKALKSLTAVLLVMVMALGIITAGDSIQTTYASVDANEQTQIEDVAETDGENNRVGIGNGNISIDSNRDPLGAKLICEDVEYNAVMNIAYDAENAEQEVKKASVKKKKQKKENTDEEIVETLSEGKKKNKKAVKEKKDNKKENKKNLAVSKSELDYEINNKFEMKLSDSEKEVLLRIVEAEAGDQDVVGRVLVANVVLNRVLSKEWPNTVEKVVFQKSGGSTQFSPTRDGSYYRVKVSKKTRQAVEQCLSGIDYSQGAQYFVMRSATSKASWFDNKLTHLFKYGCHDFYK